MTPRPAIVPLLSIGAKADQLSTVWRDNLMESVNILAVAANNCGLQHKEIFIEQSPAQTVLALQTLALYVDRTNLALQPTTGHHLQPGTVLPIFSVHPPGMQ